VAPDSDWRRARHRKRFRLGAAAWSARADVELRLQMAECATARVSALVLLRVPRLQMAERATARVSAWVLLPPSAAQPSHAPPATASVSALVLLRGRPEQMWNSDLKWRSAPLRAFPPWCCCAFPDFKWRSAPRRASALVLLPPSAAQPSHAPPAPSGARLCARHNSL
jgi:hypothetical protein